MRTLFALLALAAGLALAETRDPAVFVTHWNQTACDRMQSVFGNMLQAPCKQGVLVYVHTTDPAIEAYKVTLEYAAAGQRLFKTQMVASVQGNSVGAWFELPSIEIKAVTVEPLISSGKSVRTEY